MRYRGVWREQERNVTIVAGQKVIPPRTLVSIIEQAGLTPDEFLRLVSGEKLT